MYILNRNLLVQYLTMKKFLLIIAVYLLHAHNTTAQNVSSNYNTAVGIKIYPAAITLKHFINDKTSIEGIGYLWQYGSRITGLYEVNTDIKTVEGLKWYVGAGAHIGFWNNKWKSKYPLRESGVNIGFDGILGVDYKIKTAPLNVSLDWQPSFNLIGYNYFEGGWGGLSIRYTF
jgi:hypothetical protein